MEALSMQAGGETARLLFIVARNQRDLYESLRRSFSAGKGVQVLLDRRLGERRQRVEPQGSERRRADRRQQRVDRDLRYRSFLIIHQPQGVLSG